KDFENVFLTTLEQKNPEVLVSLRDGKLTDEATGILRSLAAEISAQY
ncbi:MAG: hypothetical protein ACI81W_003938, partial [Saprospiraceae bacterium]